jgi:hypothetical protein
MKCWRWPNRKKSGGYQSLSDEPQASENGKGEAAFTHFSRLHLVNVSGGRLSVGDGSSLKCLEATSVGRAKFSNARM